MPEKSNHEKSLLKVMVCGTALSFGILGAIVASMKGFFHGDASFTFSLRTIAGFALGCLAGWAFWKVIRWRMEQRKGP
jgi:NhaP-type Na+/H+ or K+/H+ antiporter